MSYVKKYDAGKINLDLPKISANLEDSEVVRYKHVLPLFSFGDIQHDIGLSLVFDHERYVIETESNTNPFFIAPGFKLNLQKQLILQASGIPTGLQKENGEIVSLNNYNGVFTIDDQSQGLLRVTTYTLPQRPTLLPGPTLDPGANTYHNYTIEYPDFSKEKYNDFGLITEVYDKYGDTPILSYTYGNQNNLLSISFNGSVAVTFDYENNRLSAITCNERRIRFSYDENEPFSIVHYIVQMLDGEEDGEDPIGLIHQYTISNTGLTVDAISNDFNVERTCSTKLELLDVNNNINENAPVKAIRVQDIVNNYTVNKTLYEFSKSITPYYNSQTYVDVTDNNNVTTRLQFWGDKIMCSYEVSNGEPQFDITPYQTIFPGNVTIYNISENSENKSSGIQTINDGKQMSRDSSGELSMGTDPQDDGKIGFCTVSGWINISTPIDFIPTITITSDTNAEYEHEIYNYTLGEWTYFSKTFLIQAPDKIEVNEINYGEIRDLRISFQGIATQEGDTTSYINTAYDALFYDDNAIPLSDVQFNYDINGSSSESDDGDYTSNFVTISDIMRYKLTKKRNGVCNEIFHNNGKKVITTPTELKVLYNGSYINISEFDIGTETYSKGHKSTTRICINEDDPNADIIKIHSVDGTVISEETLDDNLDVTRSENSGVITEYERDSYGLITSENVYTEDENNEKIYAKQMSYSYGTDSSGNHTMTITDEFDNDTVYTYDKVLGEISSIRLPNGKYIYNDYDAYCGEIAEKYFNSRSGRGIFFEYSNGVLSRMNTNLLNYEFEYDMYNHTLGGVKKNDVNIEHHTNQKLSMGTSTRSYYPSENNPIHSERVYTDKYGRLESIEGVLENTYAIDHRLYIEDGDISTTDRGDGKDAALAQSTDMLTDEITKYGYTKGKLTAAVTENANESILRQEIFCYDDKDRLTLDHFEYNLDGGASVTSDITYEIAPESPLADNRIKNYSYKVNGVEKVNTLNVYDEFKRIKNKKHTLGGKLFAKGIYYDNTRVCRVVDNLSEDVLYEYDNMGRIVCISDNELIIDGVPVSDGKHVTYTYDDYGQLIREDNSPLDKTFVYEYNNVGNIVSVKEYDYTTEALSEDYTEKTYTYSTSQRDRLNNFNGTAITYNAMGCPTSFNGFDATWTRGKLSGLSRQGSQISYDYNAFGQRISKTYSESTDYSYKFCYDESGRLVCETKYSDSGSTVDKIVYLYDANSVIGMDYTVGGVTSTYFLQRNLLGDVIGIYDSSRVKVGGYAYDAWGNCTITLDTTGIAYRNPIRYRGYYYDTETGLYYLNARYYNPEWRRFISPDSTKYLDPESVNGLNLYCYCNNDPVNYADPSGCSIIGTTLLIILSAVVASATVKVATTARIYVNAAISSIWDSDVRADMNSIGWNPFNTDPNIAASANKVSFYKGSAVIKQDVFGTFAFAGAIWSNTGDIGIDIQHEWGHNMQELILGPSAYITNIAIPSVANYLWGSTQDIDYYSMPWERTADLLGGVNRTSGYKKSSLAWAIVENLFGPIAIPLYFLFGY